MLKQRITIADVAEAAGVSKQTVSRAINDKGEISPATKLHILNVVDDLGYRPNRMAQAMNTNRTLMLGLVVPDITNPFFPEVARGVQDAAYEQGYTVLITNTDDHAAREIDTLEMLAMQCVDGIITFSHQADEEALKRFAASFQPMIVINRLVEHPDIDQLVVDNQRGARKAVEFFIESGHSRIAMLANKDFSPSQQRRVLGFQETLAAHGLAGGESRLSAAAPTLAGGYEATQRLLELHPDTTAIFAYNDMMGIGAIRACSDLGRKVPEDISIIGFDDIQLAAMYTPSLSTIRVDKYEMGRRAVEAILHRLDNPKEKITPVDLDTMLILRESCCTI